MFNSKFEGWYFKHQIGDEIIAFIPGQAKSGAFVQVMAKDMSFNYSFPQLTVDENGIHIGNCIFSKHGCKIELPDIQGEINYGPLAPLKSDIMGPFRYFPMQCRHGVISMAHSLSGSVFIKNKNYSFECGTGYIEKDSGTSFPKSYLWLQCNNFSQPCAIMLSIAHIPFGVIQFTGCICAIVYKGKEYRLATYNGVRIKLVEEQRIKLKQGNLSLEIFINTQQKGHPLQSPVNGEMNGIIHECCNCHVRAILHDKKQCIFDLSSNQAMFERVD